MEKSIEELVFIVEETPDGGYMARALGVSIITEADDLEMLRSQVLDAVQCHFTEEKQRPRIIRLHIVKDEVLAL
ncbi:MAG: 2-oxoisovalerate dehydrogenase E1 subunit beta [Candidatus Omnitrophica bacterium]|nr:2-oxoisovalerate dehydrogenase E1 subunit beta [Candidatus Omnitrophota bacterium]MBU0896736.1 2-oxoisovalerate dehydrogenase E1 subunit beta [Candidatus Omnitrophota bacterium]MBU1134380.1 2-oxoisovalerate dehydrogenase E1 subunit beta [Candidatus Omnitrophota bacterium]MBU1809999.1 2-oxoisovalerate dehydrogenase E1 subunit beta [Candidatus Omnitrophota bacterium]MBU2504215.1 2-oxoisovalerate dehydrogenase E1 subunit beta [Candidatus Omnitrophota bacterium]